jgi:Cu(I)/Ag(I) efflux system membrane fusion protein
MSRAVLGLCFLRVPRGGELFVFSSFRVFVLTIAAVASACAPAPQTSNTPAAGSKMPASVVDPYLNIQTALAQDRMDEVRANAGNVATAATALGAPAMKIDTAAVQLASATELEDARQKFGVLSDAIVTYMDGLHLAPPDGVRKAYCPMAAKPWLQKGDTLANPYYGASMLTCGEFR